MRITLCLTLLAAIVASPPVVCADEAVPADPLAAKSKRFFAQYDADGDGRLSRQEYPAWLDFTFPQVDGDRDGFVTPAEDLAARRAFRSQARSRPRGRSVPAGVRALRDLEYANVGGASLKLDLYLPKESAGKPPLLMWIHGGGWRKGSKAGISPVFVRLVEHGYAAASIDYRLEGLESHPKQIHDCKGALRWLRANAEKHGYDPTRVGVGGGSAGGHLSLLLGLSKGVEALEGDVGGNIEHAGGVLAIVDLFGPADLSLFANRARHMRDADREERVKAVSPVTYITADDPPILILHGDRDKLVPLDQSEVLVERCKELGLECTLHVIEGAGHGGRQFSDEQRFELVKAFLDRHVKGRGPATMPREASAD